MTKKKSYKAFYIIAAVIVALLIGIFIWNKYKYRMARKGIHQFVNQKSEGLYNIYYDDLSIDEVNGTLSVNNVQLIPDTAVYNKMVSQHKEPGLLLTLHFPKLNILAVKTPKALMNKEIRGGKLEINSPTIEIGISDLKDSSGYGSGKEIYKQILGQFKSIQVDSVVVTNASLIVKNIKTGKDLFKGDDVSVILTHLLIDSVEHENSSRILFSENMDLACKTMIIPSTDKKYSFRFENIEYISQADRLGMQRVQIIPRLSEEDFADAYKFSKDRLDFDFGKLSLIHISRESLWHKKLEADSLIVASSSFKIYRDNSRPHDSVNKVGSYPQQLIMKIPIPFYIRNMIFEHSFIEYKEKSPKTDSSGRVQFNDVDARFSNITNIPGRIDKNNICRLDFNARFLNKAPLHATLNMYLNNGQGRFDIEGTMGAMPGDWLNRITEPMALAKIEKGDISKLNFHLYGDNYNASGHLLILYNDIQVSFLKKNKETNQYDKKILSSLASDITLKKSNPSNNKLRQENVHYARDVHRSFFNLLWKSIFTGVKQTAGMK